MPNISELQKVLLAGQHQFSVIVAYSKNRVIGREGQLPWHLPADLARFKVLTLGKYVLVGRKTMESIGRSLPGRKMMVLSRGAQLQICGAPVIQDLIAWVKSLEHPQEIMLAGGAQLYTMLLPVCTQIYATEIDLEMEGDAYFPSLNALEWDIIATEAHAQDKKNKMAYRFLRYERTIK